MSTRPWDAALMAQARTRLRGLDAGEAASIACPRLSGWFKVAEGDDAGPFRGSNARWLRALPVPENFLFDAWCAAT